jgi:hypothetical protein
VAHRAGKPRPSGHHHAVTDQGSLPPRPGRSPGHTVLVIAALAICAVTAALHRRTDTQPPASSHPEPTGRFTRISGRKVALVQDHRPMGHEPTGADFGTHTDTAEVSAVLPDPGGAEQVAPGNTGGLSAYRTTRSVNRLVRSAGLRLWLFAVSLGLFIVRFLVPTPVGQADNHDGPRVMCDLGVSAVTHGSPRWFRYAYFEFAPSASGCAQAGRYPTSQLVPLELARILTLVVGLPGTVNLIALGLLNCVIASFGIASLATGLRLRLWAQVTVAAATWVIMADAAFFDVYASPFSEPAALTGLLLVAAGVVYLGRGRRETVFGLALAGSGGFLAILAKQQYLILAVPVCLTLVLASGSGNGGRGLRQFRTARTRAAIMVAVLLATMTAAYASWDRASNYATLLHREQVVDVVFSEIVTAHDDHARADLRALGLPPSWAKYAGTNSFSSVSVRHDPLYPRYEAKLSRSSGLLTWATMRQAPVIRPGRRNPVWSCSPG